VGIPASEVALAFERHATSKICSFEDLETIMSLGFRGEALPSIAAVAEVELLTISAGESVGSHLALSGGAVIKRGNAARPTGTTITVQNLFRQVPARLKFLKSRTTENSHIANVVSQYALAFPEVRFALFIDGRVVLRTAGSGRLLDCVAQVYGVDVARNTLAVGGADRARGNGDSLDVSGIIGTPAVSRSSREYLSFFLNKRWIQSRLLSWAVEEAYHGLLQVGRHPIAIINMDLPPREVDVNNHPTKTTVKFQNERMVAMEVQKAVRMALLEQMPVPRMEEPAPAYSPSPVSKQTFFTRTQEDVAGLSPASMRTPAAALPVLRVLGQLSSSYIIAEGPDGLYLIDQHAAHERIHFDRAALQLSERRLEVQGLLEPATFEVSPRQQEVLKSHHKDMAEYGFSMEPFGDRTYLVRSVPALLHDKDWVAVVREMLDFVAGGGSSNWEERLAMSIACHGAVRAGQALTIDEMREIVRQLEQSTIPHTCPHGRPTIIRFSSEQLKKEFGRT
jgi:DNA mismatch repair protein MutL